jgi:PilZ domain.
MGVSILIPHLQKKLICHNLSKTGCFFPDFDLGAVGGTLSLLIDPPEIGLIAVEARIIHKGENGKGSGLEFISMNPEDETRLLFFLDIFQS